MSWWAIIGKVSSYGEAEHIHAKDYWLVREVVNFHEITLLLNHLKLALPILLTHSSFDNFLDSEKFFFLEFLGLLIFSNLMKFFLLT